MSENQPYAHIVGHRFPGGTVTTHSHLTWLWADAVLAKQDPELVHPSYVFLMALQGTGADVYEILGMVDFAPEDGALAGAYEFEFNAPLRPDVTYRVEGQITAIERKRGKRMGLLDRLTFVVSVIDPDSDEVAITNTTVWMIPRKEEADALAE
jgi:hypothetical protein